jgi:hypothetical protein
MAFWLLSRILILYFYCQFSINYFLLVTLFERLQKKAMDVNYCLWKVTELKMLLITKGQILINFGHDKEPPMNFHQKGKGQAILT